VATLLQVKQQTIEPTKNIYEKEKQGFAGILAGVSSKDKAKMERAKKQPYTRIRQFHFIKTCCNFS
jgi:hypothetical protein